MEKRIYVTKHRVDEKHEEECCGGERHHHRHEEECCGGEKGHHKERKHVFKEFRRPPRPDKPERPHRRHKHRHHKKITKMFTSKEELVKYVNSVGEKGHQIDIFKIDEDLYKIVEVVKEEVKKEVEIVVEEE